MYLLWFLILRGPGDRRQRLLMSTLKAELISPLIGFKIVCNIMSKSVAVSIMNCKALVCLSASKTNIVSTLDLNGRGGHHAALREALYCKYIHFILF